MVMMVSFFNHVIVVLLLHLVLIFPCHFANVIFVCCFVFIFYFLRFSVIFNFTSGKLKIMIMIMAVQSFVRNFSLSSVSYENLFESPYEFCIFLISTKFTSLIFDITSTLVWKAKSPNKECATFSYTSDCHIR